MNFGQKLRNLRIERNLSQQALANEMGMSQASITAYENLVREPSFEIVRRFADYFHVPPTTLMPFDDVTDEDFYQRVVAAFKCNKELKTLFEIVRNFDDSKLSTVLTVAKSLSEIK